MLDSQAVNPASLPQEGSPYQPRAVLPRGDNLIWRHKEGTFSRQEILIDVILPTVLCQDTPHIYVNAVPTKRAEQFHKDACWPTMHSPAPATQPCHTAISTAQKFGTLLCQWIHADVSIWLAIQTSYVGNEKK